MIWNELICLGDSLTYGARNEFGRSYPAELSKILTERTGEYWFCHNYGGNRETSSDILRRCWNIFKGHPNAKLVNLWAGTNDTKIPIPLDIYRDNIIQIIRAAQIHDMIAILGTLPPIKFRPSYLKNRDYIQKYSEVIVEISNEMKLPIVDLSGLENHLIDGVHFDYKGYIKVAEKWAEKILSL